MSEPNANSIEKPDDLGTDAKAVARRWKLELKLADKREASWRKKAADIYKVYTPETPASNSFNILWTNTETLRQSVYNSLPQPDVRRRYQDEDPLGKSVGEVLTRALEFAQDTYDFDGAMQKDVLAMLLAGRAVSRICYVPDIKEAASDEVKTYEEIAWEQVICKRVQWDDFRILCAAKTWDEVTAIGFRHRFTREDLEEKFGEEIAKKISLDAAQDEDVKRSEVSDLFKTAAVWEVWDKDAKQVIWITESYPEPCKTQDDPLQLSGFFDVPRPLYAIENDQTLVPSALYTQYEQQAKELNRVSARINKLVDGLKVRGIYDSTLGELAQLMKAGDYELIGAQNVTALLERGGLEKAIWMMPIETAAAVLKELYIQRDATKQVVYEITGISDIMRSASDPNETFGAQKIKTQWGTQRLQRLQKEVQRYIRDIIRIKAEIISEKFQPETLEAMTLVQLPHQAEVDAQKKQAMLQYQQAAQQAQQQGQQPPPPPQMPPDPITWEAVIKAMRTDATRTYRVDIETDSTLSATQDSDMDGLQKLLGGMSQIIEGFGPAVQTGAMPIEAVKALMGVVVRRAKMGTAVEDALDKMQAPPPAPNPEQVKAQAAAQQQAGAQQHAEAMQQIKMQGQGQLEQFKAQIADGQSQRELQYKAQADEQEAKRNMTQEQWKQQMQAAQVQHQNDLEAARELQRQQLEAAGEARTQASDAQSEERQRAFEQWKTQIDNATKVTIAEISAKSAMNTTLAKAEATADTEVATELPDKPDTSVMDAITKLSDKVNAIHEHQQKPAERKPVKLVRGKDGKATHVDHGGEQIPIKRDAQGRVEGI